MYCLHDHAAEYRRHLAAFFGEGLHEGLRVAYTRADGVEAARADLAEIGDLDRLLAAGAVRIVPARDVYGAGGPVDPERVVATFAAATEEALADGFRGLRMSSDVTELVRTPEQQNAFVRAEFLIDCYMAGHALSALCAYGRRLGDDTVTEFASLHTAGPSHEAPFRVFGCADGALGLAGQLDPVSVAALERVLTRLRPGAGSGVLVVDLAGVEYVDHRLLQTLTACARAYGVALSLRSAPPFAARLLGLIPASFLPHAEVEAEP